MELYVSAGILVAAFGIVFIQQKSITTSYKDVIDRQSGEIRDKDAMIAQMINNQQFHSPVITPAMTEPDADKSTDAFMSDDMMRAAEQLQRTQA